MSTLVIAAHPDDEVLGCGGTIARLAREGEEVHVLILGEGAASRFEDGSDAARKAVDQLSRTSREVAAFLGAGGATMAGFPDNRFDTAPLLSIVKAIEAVIEEVRPSAVYTQHGGDLNIDHAITYRATLTAARPVEGSPVREVYAYEAPSSTEWAFQVFEPVFRPNAFVDIARTLEKKIQAMQMYETEARAFPHPRSPQAIRATAARWGSVAGLQAAEAFELVRSVRAGHPAGRHRDA